MTSRSIDRPTTAATAERGGKRRDVDLLTVALAVTVACVASLSVFHRLDISVWFDEAFTYGISTQPLSSFLQHWAWGSESNMFLYYLVMRGWIGALSAVSVAPTEVLLRAPSAVFAILSSVALFWLGRKLFGTVTGLVAAALYTLNFLQILLAQTARSYSLELLLLTLSWLLLFVALERNRPVSWGLYVGAAVLSVYSALFSGLVIIAQVGAIAAMFALPGPWRERVRNAARPIATSLVTAFVLVTPIGIDAILHGGPVWVPPAHLGSLVALALLLSGSSHLYELAVGSAACLALALVLASRLPRLRTLTARVPADLGPSVAVALWLAIPIAISFALTRPGLNLHLFFPRYLGVVIAPLCLLAGLGVAGLRWRLAQAAAALAVVLVAVPPFASYYAYAQVQDFKDPASWLEQRYRAGDGIICDPAVQCAIPMSYYFDVTGGPARFEADSPGAFSWPDNRSNPVTSESVRSYAAGHPRIFLVFGPLAQEDVLKQQDAAIQAELVADGYRLVGQITGRGSAVDETVYLYEATPAP